MPGIIAFTILLFIYAVSELIAKRTRAIISTVLAIAILMLLGFWSHLLPPTIFDDTGVKAIGTIMAGILITSLGTTIDLDEIKSQWRIVIIALSGVLGATLLILIGGALFNLQPLALAGAPIFAGGSAATLIILAAIEGKSLEIVATFAVALLVLQKFVGIPIASYFLKKEAKRLHNDPKWLAEHAREAVSEDIDATQKKPLALPAESQTPMIYLFKLGFVASLAYGLEHLLHDTIPYFVLCLILGVIFYLLGFLEKGILAKTKADGLILFLVTVLIFSSLTDTTPQQVVSVIFPLLLFMTLGVLGVIVIGFTLSKYFNMSSYLAIALGISCTFGFPTTLFLPKEVATSVGETPEEKATLEAYLLPKMLVAGIVTVTIASVLLAGIAIHYL